MIKGVPMGQILLGEVEAQVLTEESAGSARARAGLCLLRSVSDHCLFPCAWGCCKGRLAPANPWNFFVGEGVQMRLKAARPDHTCQEHPELPLAGVVEEQSSWWHHLRSAVAMTLSIPSFHRATFPSPSCQHLHERASYPRTLYRISVIFFTAEFLILMWISLDCSSCLFFCV